MVTVNQVKSRVIERVFLLLITLLLSFLFYELFQVLKRDFDEVPKRLAEGTMVNLNVGDAAERLALLLEKGFYFDDKRDIEIIRNSVAQGLLREEGAIDNIGELNKSRYNVDAELVFAQGGSSFKRRATLSRTLIGFSNEDSIRYEKEKKSLHLFLLLTIYHWGNMQSMVLSITETKILLVVFW